MKKVLLQKKIPAILIMLLLTGKFSTAQPFTMNPAIVPEELHLYNYNPSSNPKAKGRLNVTDVTQTADTMYFFAQGFSIYSPGYVGITMQDKSASVEVAMFKENWLKEDRKGTTNDKGHWDAKFKTEGDLGIRVIAKTKPCTYALVVWNGSDVEVPVPSAFEYGKSGTGGGAGGFLKNNWLYIVIGVLVIAVLLLFIKLKKRRS
jgi:hypothetical protein